MIAYLWEVKKKLNYFIISALLVGLSLPIKQGFGQQFDLSDTNSTEQQTKPPKKRFFKTENIFVGGSLGGGFASGAGMFQVSPIVGYSFTERFQSAMKVSYTYLYGKDPFTLQRYADHVIATSLINRYVVYNGVFLQVEPEVMNRNAYSYERNSLGVEELVSKRINVFNLYVGGGAYLNFSGNTGGFILLLYNLNQTENSFYSNPHIQAGFTVGF